jgi:predicted transcriptional regulator
MTEKTTATKKAENLGSMSLRVDKDLLKSFQTIAKANNRNASMLLRDYMASYVKKHGQGDLFK